MLLGSLVALALAAEPQPEIRRLDWMIGEWDFADESTSPTDDYEERGVRSCGYALDGQYIRCESRGTSRGRTRTYVFYLNYNRELRRYEMLSMWGNVPGKALQVGSASADGRRIELQTETPYAEGAEIRRAWAVITYDGAGAYVWDSGSGPDGAPRGEARYRDLARRRAATP